MSSSNATAQPPAIRAYLGGSFDPVHKGHLQMAMTVYERLAPLAAQLGRPIQVALMPTARSPFKDRSTDARQRLAMLTLATHLTPIDICTDELWQEPPVYTINTVKALRAQYPNDTLIFIMGSDSAASLPRWKQGLELTDFVHLWIFARQADRPGHQANDTAHLVSALPESLQAKVTDNVLDLLTINDNDLKAWAGGRIYRDNTEIVAVSSSEVRAALASSDSAALQSALPPIVYDYIAEQRLYCHANG
ncbi:nicotinate (nicotinamide) nucleotide adenylyltransferase [Psychrobacter pygoscelis]|uniref:nicotinate (nicotinamide) nucleotide adenylyltransferase n=1 Tax=Psychrobacter pygoscelis TaxID=2488563 RepID=UPI00104046B0|nr:nicotinate (nicotinamide) nucleotide adenylyltransferase [Psychrobacter pygoscelis]